MKESTKEYDAFLDEAQKRENEYFARMQALEKKRYEEAIKQETERHEYVMRLLKFLKAGA